jgi:eukaryotic-like serine/threonine-protein kinase
MTPDHSVLQSEPLKNTAPPKPAAPVDAQLPRSFGRLTLLKAIARGGMGEVYLATTGGIEGAERPCVVKIIRREHVEDPSFLARFLDEARIQAQLDHPGVARVLEAETDPKGKPHVVVEYIEGRNLAEVRNRSSELNARINWADAVAIAVSLADALCYVHERTDHEGQPLDIVHRDLSPQNVMVAYGGDVKLIDFGTARGENRRCHTVSGVVLAKPGYVAPEVANDTPGGVPADLYALGVILWELCTGRRFLTGDPQAHVRAVASGQKSPSPIATLVEGPPQLDTIIARMTAPRVEDRYGSARALMADLVRLLKQAPSMANGERSVRARVGHLMDRLYPAEPMRSRAELARLVGVARDRDVLSAAAHAPSPSPPPARQDHTLFPGTRYQLIREIGRGAMGIVYEAQHVDIGRRVALKVLPKERSGSAELEDRFRREARAIARLKHEHIALLHDFGIASDGRPFYAMELCEGETLEQRLATHHTLPWQQALNIAAELCQALSAAHVAGLVHRDIKPGNLFITRAGSIKLLDFGVAQTNDEVSDPSDERAIRLTGTVEYMAPEQAAGQPVDQRADLYAVGAVLYECLTGERPHVAEGLTTLLALKSTSVPLPPSARATDHRIPRAVDRLVLRALERDPARRFSSAVAMLESILDASQPNRRWQSSKKSLAIGAAALVAGVLLAALVTKGSIVPSGLAPRESALAIGTPESSDSDSDESPPVAYLHEAPRALALINDDSPSLAPSPADAFDEAAANEDDAASEPENSSPVEDDGSLPPLNEALTSALAAVDRYATAGRHVKALSESRRLSERYPDDPRILSKWTRAAVATNGWGEALKAAIRWASVDPSLDAQLSLARVQRAVGQQGGAVATLERILRSDPDNPQARQLMAAYSPSRLAAR